MNLSAADLQRFERLVNYWRLLAVALKNAGITEPGPGGLLRAADDLEREVQNVKMSKV